MNKYNIEDGKDFFSELYKSLDEDDLIDESNLCLITKEPLTDKYIKFNCGHNFNYIPLFNDIKNYKQKFNSLEKGSSKLKVDEIRCPYCRHIQKGLLPYYEDIGFKQIHGVNYINPSMIKLEASLNSTYKECEWLIPNPDYDPNKGNNKHISCIHNGKKVYCPSIVNNEYNVDEKYYCHQHKIIATKLCKQAIQNWEKEEKDKIKEEQKQKQKEEKDKIKEEKQKEKQKQKEEKDKIKEEKDKIKEEKKQKQKEEKNKIKTENTENIVLGPSEVSNTCVNILKSGLNKGKQCCSKIYMENLCKKHFTSKNKIKKEEINI
jgi:hypothetical protein